MTEIIAVSQLTFLFLVSCKRWYAEYRLPYALVVYGTFKSR
jgi:hypothetical protein